MNKVKQAIAILLTVGAVGAVLSSCGEKPPTEEITTGTEIHQLVDTYGVLDSETSAAKSKTEAGKDESETEKSKKSAKGTKSDAEEDKTEKGKTEKDKSGKDKKSEKDKKADKATAADAAEESTTAATRVSDVEFVLQNYYTDGTNYGEIQNITFDDKAFASTAYGYLDVKMTYVGSRNQNLVIGYRAYDENGNVCRNARVVVKLNGVKSGETVERIRFNVPFNAVKVEFFDIEK